MSNPSTASVSVKGAADRLASALGALEGALDPVLARLARAESALAETQGFGEDRAALASELDAAKADTQELESRLKVREEEFAALSSETRQELDATIATLRDVLSGAA